MITRINEQPLAVFAVSKIKRGETMIVPIEDGTSRGLAYGYLQWQASADV